MKSIGNVIFRISTFYLKHCAAFFLWRDRFEIFTIHSWLYWPGKNKNQIPPKNFNIDATSGGRKIKRAFILQRVWGLFGGWDTRSGFLGNDIVQSGRRATTFRRNTQPHFFGGEVHFEDKDSPCFRNSCCVPTRLYGVINRKNTLFVRLFYVLFWK
jgi:hypothetical protein